jgi:hypothetical protein
MYRVAFFTASDKGYAESGRLCRSGSTQIAEENVLRWSAACSADEKEC